MDDTTLALDLPVEVEYDAEEAAVQVGRSPADLSLLRHLSIGIGVSLCIPGPPGRQRLASCTLKSMCVACKLRLKFVGTC